MTATAVHTRKLTREELAAHLGAQTLDRHWPDWWQRYDLSRHNVGDAFSCPLSQASGMFFLKALEVVDLFPANVQDWDRARSCGFLDGDGVDLPSLNAAWRIEVERRRQESTR